MSRFKRFSKSLVTGYALMGVNVLYTLTSVPLALKYLSLAEFSLWALMSQIASFAQMLDLGMGSSVARILIDHKDERASGRYGSTIKAGLLVGTVQGAIVLILGASTIWYLAGWLRVPLSLSHSFFWLIAGQILLSAATFLTRVPGQILFAWQRMDLQNYGQMAQFCVGLLVLWVGFALHWGVYSLLASSVAAWVTGSSLSAYFCRQLGLWPHRNEWGRVAREEFRQMFNYGADLFLMSLGVQLVMSSQVLLVSRTLGTEAVAVWSVMTKLYGMATQLILRFVGYAMPAFAEMMARRETNRMWERYRTMFIMSTVIAGGAAIMLMAGNSLFVRVWTQNRISWSPYNDFLLAILIILSTQQCCHNSFIACLKAVREVKYTLFIEGVVFVISSLLLLPHWGLTGMLICAVTCTFLFTWVNGTWRIARMARENHQPPIWRWHLPVIRLLALVIPCWLGLMFLFHERSAFWQLLIICTALALLGAFVALRYALPPALTAEMLGKLPRPLRSISARLAR